MLNYARPSAFSLIAVLLSGVLLLFVVAPLIRLVLATPVADMAGALQDEELWQSIALTLRAAAVATLISTVCGVMS